MQGSKAGQERGIIPRAILKVALCPHSSSCQTFPSESHVLYATPMPLSCYPCAPLLLPLCPGWLVLNFHAKLQLGTGALAVTCALLLNF